jgi:hypothetical protein
MIRRAVTAIALIAILLQSHITANACGPSYLQPIFVSETSPDLPFTEYAAGNIGIIKPSLGRKTLLIAYRYLNGGSFSAAEQKELVSALDGSAPEADGDEALKSWIELRKQISPEEELPEIYRERNSPFSGYDYFPNCARNAFEVATTTLNDRVAGYTAQDVNVREWIRGQDQVFANCSGGTPNIPSELPPAAPLWLRKDRDYQIAAALFYSLQLDEALARFEKIANDAESNWQTTAEYLIARTLVRQASLTPDQQTKALRYARAEMQLTKLSAGNNQFAAASRKLLGLVSYRTRPESRLVELAEIVSRDGASLDLRQDVIDYVWLLDKFEGEILKKEHDRQEALRKKERGEEDQSTIQRVVRDETESDDQISVSLMPKFADGSPDYQNIINLRVPFDTPEAQIFRELETRLHRQLTDEEQKQIRGQVSSSLEYRKWRISYNRKLTAVATNYEGCYYCYDIKLHLTQLPSFIVSSDLSDWIFTLQLEGPETYEHALTRWRDTESPAWLAAALVKAEAASPDVARLMQAGERVTSDSPAFPTVAFNLVRLNLALGRMKPAQDLLDGVKSRFEELPLSAQNEFQRQRMQVAGSVAEFLKYAARKPVAFYDEGLFTSIRDIVEEKKSYWGDYELEESKEDYEKRVEQEYHELLDDDLRLFDDNTADIFDRHFSIKLLQQAARDPQLSKYLRHRLTIIVWTRALLLKNREVALEVAPDVVSSYPEMAQLVDRYVQAKTPAAQEHAALYVLLKSPPLTPFLANSSIQFMVFQDLDYYLESAWWCAPSETDYRNGEEVKKSVPAPAFIDRQQLAAAKREFDELVIIGDAKTYLGGQVLEWARQSPGDTRIPEALFIAVNANRNYKYGCGGWEHDDEIREAATKLLRERYPQSPWTAKLESSDGQ